MNYHRFIEFTLIFLLLFSNSLLLNAQKQKETTIAMCQIFCLDGDRSGNFLRIGNAIVEAKEKGAEIVCFPETSILGWVNPKAHDRAFPIPGEDSDRLCELARKYKIYLCVGLAEKEEDKLFDSVILIDDHGEIILKHRKINILTELMTPPYSSGSTVNVVKTKFGRIGMLICADTFLEEYVQKMAEHKPDILLVPYGWAAPEEEWPEHAQSLHNVVAATAEITGAFVVGTDLVGEITHGPWTGQVYGGQSVIAGRDGQIIAVAKDRDRDIVVIKIMNLAHSE